MGRQRSLHAECSAAQCGLAARRLGGGPSSLDGLDAGGLEAGELQLHAAFELVEQLLQQLLISSAVQLREGVQRQFEAGLAFRIEVRGDGVSQGAELQSSLSEGVGRGRRIKMTIN